MFNTSWNNSDIEAGLITPYISGFSQELETDKSLDIRIDEEEKELQIESPNPEAVLTELQDSLFNLSTNQILQLKPKQGEPKWKIKDKEKGLEILAPYVIFKAIAVDYADNTAIKEIEFKRGKYNK